MDIVLLLIMLTGLNLYSQDYWEDISFTDSLHWITTIEINQTGDIYVGTNSGIYYSPDEGDSFHKLEYPELDDVNIQSIYCVNDSIILAGSNRKIYRSTDKGATWSDTGLDGWSENIIVDSESNIYAVNFDRIYKSTDDGENWLLLTDYFQNSGLWSFYVTIDGNMIVGSTCGLYLSEDDGENWEFIRSFTCGDITAIGSMNNDETLFIGGADRFHGLYSSDDGGFTWNYIPTIDTIKYAYDIIQVNESEIFICSRYNGIIKYNNVTGESNYVHEGIKPFTNNDSTISYSVTALAIDNAAKVYASSGTRLYRLANPVVSHNETNSIYYFTLSNNYPNPFNPSTTISYQLPKSDYVSIIISDILGKQIAVLYKGYKESGSHELEFDASNYTSGTYIYSITTSNGRLSNKMLLVK